MTTCPLIWINPGPNDAFQCWSTSVDGGESGPTIFIDVELKPTEYPEEPYRFEARVAEVFVITKGGRSTLAEAQQIVAGAVIAHLEELLAQVRSLVPSGYPPAEPGKLEPLRPSPLDPDVIRALYITKAIERTPGDLCGLAPDIALWIAICELLEAQRP